MRIEAQYYSGPLFCDSLFSGWHVGSFDFLVLHTPLKHLREGVIDAWIGFYPDVPGDDDGDLMCFHLTHLPVHLVVARDHPLLDLRDSVALEDVKRYPSLVLSDHAFPKVQEILQGLGLWNLPLNVQRYRDIWQEKIPFALAVGYATSFSMHLFRTPQVVLPVQIPFEVGDTLIVRRDYVDHPRLIELRGYLKQKSLELARRFGDVRVL